MFKRNSGIRGARPKLEDIEDKQNKKIHLLFSIRSKGDNTQASTRDKTQIANNKI